MRLPLLIIGLLFSLTFTKAQSEQSSLDVMYLLEEEKLARDVYSALFDEWGMQVFDHIKASEQRHLDLMIGLAKKDKLTLPTTLDKVGVFENASLQKAYKEFVTKGKKSKLEALKVGAKIEEMDITDLKSAIKSSSEEDKAVYEKLLKASYNHLRAFSKNISKQGQTYEPVVLTTEAYGEIINSPKQGCDDAKMGDQKACCKGNAKQKCDKKREKNCSN